MKYIYILSWCILYSLSTDSTFINNKYRIESNCENREVFIYKINAEKEYSKLVEKRKEFNGFITYDSIRIDSVMVDSSLKDETLIKLYK